MNATLRDADRALLRYYWSNALLMATAPKSNQGSLVSGEMLMLATQQA